MFIPLLIFLSLDHLSAIKLSHRLGHRRVAYGWHAINYVYPFNTQANLILPGKTGCTGTIIHRKWVLTVAHCVKKYKPEDIQIFYGGTARQNSTALFSEKLITHPGFDKSDIDVGLIKVRAFFKDANIVPTKLWSSDFSLNKKTDKDGIIHLCGYGKTEQNEKVELGTLSCMHYVKLKISREAKYLWTANGKLFNSNERDPNKRVYQSACPVSIHLSLHFVSSKYYAAPIFFKGDSGAGVFYSGKQGAEQYKFFAIMKSGPQRGCPYADYNELLFLNSDITKWIWQQIKANP